MECMKDDFRKGVILGGNYETISPLNHGSFGMVFLARDIRSDTHVAVKCITKEGENKTADGELGERECHQLLGHHANIVNVLDSFESINHQYLVLEYCSMGDLYEAIRHGHGPKETENVRDLMLQLVSAVEYMHVRGLSHRDIKPENIFLCHDGTMKLGDLGLATADSWSHDASVGSDRYMAPEQHEPPECGYAPSQADVWAIGICLLNIIFSRNPFVVPHESDVLFADFARDAKSLFDIFPNMSNDTFEVLTAALAIDPLKRSLSGVRSALSKATHFTADDDIFDEFCTEERDLGISSADRQPLRTPSISSPPTASKSSSGAFPWSKALRMTMPHHKRQLSAIADTESCTEDLFQPADADRRSWISWAQDSSVTSGLDSRLGASVSSLALIQPPTNRAHRTRPMAVPAAPASSLPTRSSALDLFFGKDDNNFSKSWTDMYDEDEEENRLLHKAADPLREEHSRHINHKRLSLDQASISDSESSAAADTDDREDMTKIVRHSDDSNCEIFTLEEGPASLPNNTDPKEPTVSSRRSIMDKWAILGNRRRQIENAVTNSNSSGHVSAPVATTAPELRCRPVDTCHEDISENFKVDKREIQKPSDVISDSQITDRLNEGAIVEATRENGDCHSVPNNVASNSDRGQNAISQESSIRPPPTAGPSNITAQLPAKRSLRSNWRSSFGLKAFASMGRATTDTKIEAIVSSPPSQSVHQTLGSKGTRRENDIHSQRAKLDRQGQVRGDAFSESAQVNAKVLDWRRNTKFSAPIDSAINGDSEPAIGAGRQTNRAGFPSSLDARESRLHQTRRLDDLSKDRYTRLEGLENLDEFNSRHSFCDFGGWDIEWIEEVASG